MSFCNAEVLLHTFPLDFVIVIDLIDDQFGVAFYYTLDESQLVMSASYSVPLLVVLNVRVIAYLWGSPSGGTRTKLTPKPSFEEDLSV